MQKYYSEVEKQYFWGNERKNVCEVDEEKLNEGKVDGEKVDTKVDMAQSELVDGIFTNPDETDDYYKGKASILAYFNPKSPFLFKKRDKTENFKSKMVIFDLFF